MTKFLPVLAFALACVSPAAAAPFSFVALGDMPYGKPEEVNPLYEQLIGTVNARAPSFVIHIGDIKSGSTLCDDTMLTTQLGYLNSFAAPVLYTPGDNEWTDCYRKAAGKFDPLERLDFLRKTFFKDGSMSLGKTPVAVESQAKVMPEFSTYVENARTEKDGVMFVTAHVVGSNNNFEVRDPKAVAEFFARDAADVAWLNASFDKAIADNAKAIVLAFQADMFEFDFNDFGDETFLRHSGFLNFGGALVAKAVEFKKPVLIVYGDSHHYQVSRPFPTTAPNITALEVFGEADMHAVEVSVDPEDPAVFAMRPVYNPAMPLAPKPQG